MVYADLHAHTTRSDGSLTLSTLPDAKWSTIENALEQEGQRAVADITERETWSE